uniref:Transcriptional activator cubitus interruptus (inferred by orthology to a D. melanogaster protein) n=1 Tax=Strongyloides venezuelensis TaxID=75913 RepID=A0A0K0EWV0_STRVS
MRRGINLYPIQEEGEPLVEDSLGTYYKDNGTRSHYIHCGNYLEHCIQRNYVPVVSNFCGCHKAYQNNSQYDTHPNIYYDFEQNIQRSPNINQHMVNSNQHNTMTGNFYHVSGDGNYDNIQDNNHHNNQFTALNNSLLIDNNGELGFDDNISIRGTRYNKQYTRPKSVFSNGSISNEILSKFQGINNEISNVGTEITNNTVIRNINNISDEFTKQLSIPEIDRYELGSHFWKDNFEGRFLPALSDTQSEYDVFQDVDRGLSPSELIEHECFYDFMEDGGFNPGESKEIICSSEVQVCSTKNNRGNNSYGVNLDLPTIDIDLSVVGHDNDRANSIIRYESIGNSHGCYTGTNFKDPNVVYDQCYSSNISTTENYQKIPFHYTVRNFGVDDSHNNGVQSEYFNSLREGEKVSQSIKQPSEYQIKGVDANNIGGVLKHNNFSKQTIIVNNFESDDKTHHVGIQHNANIISHNNGKSKFLGSRKRQQKKIANVQPDSDENNSDPEQANKRLKVHINIRCYPSSTDISISTRNVSISDGSEHEHVFCRWEGCDYYFTNIDDLYEHVCSEHEARGKIFYCQWKSCLACDKKKSSSFVSLDDFLKHMFDHVNVKQFFCGNDDCKSPDGFYTKKELEDHVKKCYRVRKVFICRESLCTATFTCGNSRLCHEKKIHIKKNVSVYLCPIYNCAKTFPDPSGYQRHVRSSHGLLSYEMIKHMKHTICEQGNTKKLFGLLTKRVASHLTEEMLKFPQSEEKDVKKDLLLLYDCLDICVHKDYSSMKNILEKMVTDMKDRKIRTPVNAHINKYVARKKPVNGVIVIGNSFILQLSDMIFKNLEILNYPILSISKDNVEELRKAELLLTKQYIYMKLEEDEKNRQNKLRSSKRTDEIDSSFNKMPDQLSEDEKYVEEFIYIEEDFSDFGKPIDSPNFNFSKLSGLSLASNPYNKLHPEKTRNGRNSPTLRDHKTPELCPAYLMRVLINFKKYLKSSKYEGNLSYKNKVALYTKIPEKFQDPSKEKKTRNNKKKGDTKVDNKEKGSMDDDNNETGGKNDNDDNVEKVDINKSTNINTYCKKGKSIKKESTYMVMWGESDF